MINSNISRINFHVGILFKYLVIIFGGGGGMAKWSHLIIGGREGGCKGPKYDRRIFEQPLKVCVKRLSYCCEDHRSTAQASYSISSIITSFKLHLLNYFFSWYYLITWIRSADPILLPDPIRSIIIFLQIQQLKALPITHIKLNHPYEAPFLLEVPSCL